MKPRPPVPISVETGFGRYGLMVSVGRARRVKTIRTEHPGILRRVQGNQSSVLCPTTNAMANEARIDVSDPLFGKPIGQVCLRPVLLPQLERLVTSRASQARLEREAFAKRLAFGM